MASSNTTWGPPAPRRSLVLCHLPCPLSPHSLAYLEKMYQEQRWLAPQDVPWPSLVTYRNSLQPQEERGSVNSRSTAPRPPPGSAAKRPRIDGEVGAEPGGGGPRMLGATPPPAPQLRCAGLGGACPALSLAVGTAARGWDRFEAPQYRSRVTVGQEAERWGGWGGVGHVSAVTSARAGLSSCGHKDRAQGWGQALGMGTQLRDRVWGWGCGPSAQPSPAAPSEHPDSSPWPSSRLPSPALTSTVLRGGPRPPLTRPPAQDPGSDPGLLQR